MIDKADRTKFVQWEIFLVKASAVIAIAFILIGIILGPIAAKIEGMQGIGIWESVRLGSQGGAGLFLVGSSINAIVTSISLLRKKLGK